MESAGIIIMGDKKEAVAAKDAGNAAFKKGDYEAALVSYETAIKLEPDNAVYIANKAMVHLKMKNWEQAETDCNQAVELDAKYAKVKLIFISDHS